MKERVLKLRTAALHLLERTKQILINGFGKVSYIAKFALNRLGQLKAALVIYSKILTVILFAAIRFLKKYALKLLNTLTTAFKRAVGFLISYKKRVVKVISLFLCFFILLAYFPSAGSAPDYKDVPNSYWAYKYIKYLSERGFIQGYVGKKFSPESFMTKAEFTAIACRMTGMDDTKMEKTSYWAESDIQYALYMKWFTAAEMPQSSYAEPITRELAAKIVMRAFFPDVAKSGVIDRNIYIKDEDDIGKENLRYVKLAYTMGILTGYEDGTFQPKDEIARSEASALIFRAWQKYNYEPNGLESVTVPILLYHHISNQPGFTTPDKFRSDMEALKRAGFNTIFYSELNDYVANGKPLPKKPVIISFDDGYYSNYQYAYPVLKDLGMKAEISIIGCWVGIKQMQGVIPHFSWSEANEMQDTNNVHIESHSYRMHDYDPSGRVTRYGVMKRPDENYEQYIRALVSDTRIITAMIQQNMDSVPLAYTYPNGFSNPLSEKLLHALGYKVTLTTKVGINTVIKGYPSSLMHMKRIAVDNYDGDVVYLIYRSYF